MELLCVLAYDELMDNFLVNKKDMEPIDWLFDGAVALSAFVFGCLQLLISSSSFMAPDEVFLQLLGIPNVMPQASAYMALALTTLPLVFRRKFSWPVFIFVTITFLGTQGLLRGNTFAIIGPMVAIYTIARERGRNEAIIATVLSVAALLFVAAPAKNESLAALMRLQNITYLVASALGGFALRSHQEYVAETEQRAIAAEKGREEEAARRVEEERVRIAREIHDITAHSLSAVSIQAAVAQRLIDKDPQAAKDAIITIRATSKNALEEIRSMIGVLRADGSGAETAPTTGTDRMGDLVTYLEDAGIAVTLDMDTYQRERVPAYIDVALFGIAREAATNILRHSQAKVVTIGLSLGADHVRLSVEDDGVGWPGALRAEGCGSKGSLPFDSSAHAAAAITEGHGLQGMAERVSLLDGTFSAHNRASSGFVIQVDIPFNETGKHHG